jgi:Mg-chelatase subunit ChlD
MKISILPIVFFLSLAVYGQQAGTAPAAAWQYVLLNDKSGRTLWLVGIEQQPHAAAQLLKEVVKPGSDVGSLVNFGEDFLLEVENSTDPAEIAAKLARPGHHGTRLYDALVSSAEWLAKQESSDKLKLIFVFSDGDDNASQTSLPQTIAALQRTQIPVIVVAPSVIEHKPQGKNLKQLATRTGGHAYFLQQNKDFDFTLIKRDLARWGGGP